MDDISNGNWKQQRYTGNMQRKNESITFIAEEEIMTCRVTVDLGAGLKYTHKKRAKRSVRQSKQKKKLVILWVFKRETCEYTPVEVDYESDSDVEVEYIGYTGRHGVIQYGSCQYNRSYRFDSPTNSVDHDFQQKCLTSTPFNNTLAINWH